MKHIKLFEQFEEDEDAWWEEESQFDRVRDLTIVKNGKNFYLAIDSDSNKISMFDASIKYNKGAFNFNPRFNYKNDVILILNDNFGLRKYLYEDLPKEIKDRIKI